MNIEKKLTLPQLCETGGETNIFYKNIFIYDKTNPLKKIIQKIENIQIENDSLVIVPSPAFFYGIKELLEKLSASCRVIFIEKEKELYSLKEVLQNKAAHNVLTKIIADADSNYINTDAPDEFIDFFEKRSEFAFIKKAVLLPLNNGYVLNRDFYAQCFENLKKSLKNSLKNSLTLFAFGKRYYKNIFLNFCSYVKWHDIKDICLKEPVLVAGAGESLEKSLNVIKANRNLFKIIAIDTALKTLTDSGITPDFVLAVESQIHNIFDFNGNNFSAIPLIADMTTYPLTSRIFKGEKYYFISEFEKSGFIKKLLKNNFLPSVVPPLGSVGVTAVYIASLVTSSLVFYTGLDFGFRKGKTHAKNSPAIINSLLQLTRLSSESNYALSISRELIKLNNVDNGELYTTAVLKSYSDTMAELVLKNQKIYSLFKSYTTANKNFVPDEDSFKLLLEECSKYAAESEKQFNAKKSIEKNNLISSLISLCDVEIQKIDAVINAGINIINGISAKENSAEIKTLLKDSSYLMPQYHAAKKAFAETSQSNASQTSGALFSGSIDAALDSVTVKHILLNCYSFKKTIKTAVNLLTKF